MYLSERPPPYIEISKQPTAPHNIPTRNNDTPLRTFSSGPKHYTRQQSTISQAQPASYPTPQSVIHTSQLENSDRQQWNMHTVPAGVYPSYQESVIQSPPVSHYSGQSVAAIVTQPNNRVSMTSTYAFSCFVFLCCFGLLGLIAFIFAGKHFTLLSFNKLI